jgi:dual oxidase maturation factor 1
LYINKILIFSKIVCNFEYAWESDVIKVNTQYKTGINKHINATIGLHIGLRGINITLKGTPEKYFGETIDYNEHFSWEWNQGREGYGTQGLILDFKINS